MATRRKYWEANGVDWEYTDGIQSFGYVSKMGQGAFSASSLDTDDGYGDEHKDNIRTLTAAKNWIKKNVARAERQGKRKNPMARKKKGLDLSNWTPVAAIKKVGNKLHILRNPGPQKNIAMGFYGADGLFHPIRASRDYDPDRGEAYRYDDEDESPRRKSSSKRKVATKKRATKKAAKKKAKKRR